MSVKAFFPYYPVLVGFAAIAFVGCFGTVTPKSVKPASGNFDGSTADSGFVRWTNQPYAHCGVFTATAVGRYNLLALRWGADARFVPAIKPWDGVLKELDGKTFTNFVLSPAAIVNFQLLSSVQRQNAVKP